MIKNHDSDDQGSEKGDRLPHVDDPFLFKIKGYILNMYEPVATAADADVRMTTLEIFRAINDIYPGAPIDLSGLATWLNDQGFTFFETGKMRFEWLLKSATN